MNFHMEALLEFLGDLSATEWREIVGYLSAIGILILAVVWVRTGRSPLYLAFSCYEGVASRLRRRSASHDKASKMVIDIQRDRLGGVSMEKEFSPIKDGIEQLQHKYPELRGLPLVLTYKGYDSWFREAQKRFQLESYSRTQAKQSIVLEQVIKLEQQYLTIRKLAKDHDILDAEDYLRGQRLAAESAELDLKIARSQMEHAKLREQSKPPVSKPPDGRSRAQRILADLARLREERNNELAKCKGDPGCEDTVNRIYDDEELRVKEGR